MKRTMKDPKSPTAKALAAPRPVGAPRKFKAEDYMELTNAFRQTAEADAAVQQVTALAQRSVGLARQLHQQAVARMKKVMGRHGLPDGFYAPDDDRCTLQRMEE